MRLFPPILKNTLSHKLPWMDVGRVLLIAAVSALVGAGAHDVFYSERIGAYHAEEAAVAEGGAGEVLVDWPEDGSEWEVAVAVDEEASTAGRLFRRGQRVPRAVRTALAKQGADVRIVLRRTSGDLGGVGAQMWPA